MFTPIHSFLGGTLLFLASQQYISIDRTFGCSSILSTTCLAPRKSVDGYQAHTLVGMLAGALAMQYLPKLLVPASVPMPQSSLLLTAIAGLFVGLGTRLANGCTSGHMLNGVARLSLRSIVATCCFFASAVGTVYTMQTAPIAVAAYKTDPADSRHIAPLLALVSACFATAWTVRRAVPQVVTFTAGINFAIGLLVSGMSLPQKTLGFLNLTSMESFDPSLLMIVLGGLLPNMAAYLYNGTPSQNRTIDAKLIGGSILFGIGWGLHGICPGPAIVNMVTPSKDIIVFVLTTLLGSALVVK